MKLSSKILAGALIAAIPMSAAFACNTSAWSSVTGAPVADDPDSNNATNNNPDQGAVPRYSGICGLRTANAASYVVTDHPTADTTYRARFYVHTSATAPVTVFQAYSDAGATTSAIQVQYTPNGANGSFSFTVPGSTIADVTGIEANKWYGIEVARTVGAPATVAVRGGGGGGVGGNPAQARQSIAKLDVTRTGTGNASGAGVEIARLGAVSGAAGQFFVDEFDSSRGNTAIGFLMRSDANNSSTVDAGDVAAIVRESVGQQTFTGQPDCNESGTVDAGDVACVARFSVGL